MTINCQLKVYTLLLIIELAGFMKIKKIGVATPRKTKKLKAYTKLRFIAYVAKQLGLPKNQTEFILNIVFSSVKVVLKKGYRFNIEKFGVFIPKDMDERSGFNLSKREHMLIPKRRRVKFVSSKLLNEELNGPGKEPLKEE